MGDILQRIEPADLAAAGRALYGERWQSALGRDLRVNSRRVRQWMSEDRPIPLGVLPEIIKLLTARRGKIDTTLSQLEKI